ncbi:U-box domain-containing protein 51-like [Zingiber officinale]|uniref:U-box domain-containing protein 51-like n=1 Tax=Zingiber officinale TaxID=94328 RepID=UPI001C4B4180|nr:U-box domain-containing protein 51-like [Zingiber officinale]
MSHTQASPLLAIAVDRDKNSQSAFKWALDNLITAKDNLTLVHVNTKSSSLDNANYVARITREIISPFRCFCTRKNVQCKDVIIEGIDVARAIIEFVSNARVEKLVVGASRSGFLRSLRSTDLSTSIYKGVPEFCTVYVIAKGKVSFVRNATRLLPAISPFRAQVQGQPIAQPNPIQIQSNKNDIKVPSEAADSPRNQQKQNDSIKTPFNRGGKRAPTTKSQEEIIMAESDGSSDQVEEELRMLKFELKQTKDMYNTARKDALTATRKAMVLQHWKRDEERHLEKARLAAESAITSTDSKTSEASEHAFALPHRDVRYRRYAIEEIEEATENFAESRKIGEGGYGPVYKCFLDHTPVAIKVLRPDCSQGMSQFHQELDILCCIRHPNMVLLVGACPEYGCLVYEYMANGSLEDRLLRRGNTPAIPWQHRFRIAAEIGTGLLFLHQTKPEPLVHRDLKPGNILLDRSFVSKISDVGLARLVPPSVANSVTQYRMTATAGTFCYIDPEYQQSGMLGTKSDVYSIGIILLQLVTGKAPMGLTHCVESAIEKGTFEQVLDPSVPDWPVEEALSLAKLALRCSELRRKERPDLGKVILPELNRLREFAEGSIQQDSIFGASASSAYSHFSERDALSGPATEQSGSESWSRC